jgi:predicted nucleic acid-binding protein
VTPNHVRRTECRIVPAKADGLLPGGDVTDWRRTIAVRYPTAACLDAWTALAARLRRTGQDVHDLFLIAQMQAHGIGEVCTLNAGDFASLRGITVRHPEAV